MSLHHLVCCVPHTVNFSQSLVSCYCHYYYFHVKGNIGAESCLRWHKYQIEDSMPKLTSPDI